MQDQCPKTQNNGIQQQISIKGVKDADTFRNCLESEKIQRLTSFGQLYRVGVLKNEMWTMEIPTEAKMCQPVYAIPEIEVPNNQESISHLQECVKGDVSEPACKSNFMVVDSLASRIACHRLALFVGY